MVSGREIELPQAGAVENGESSAHDSVESHDPFADYRLGDSRRASDNAALQPKPGETTKEAVLVDGDERHYFLHAPKNAGSSEKVPLVLVFHGYGDEPGQGGVPAGAEGMEALTGFSDVADRENFVVAYLNGNEQDHNSWNNGQWFFSKKDDIKFVNRTIEEIAKKTNADPEQLYIVGLSNGASFAHRLANQLGDRVAGVADVSGWMTGKEDQKQSATCSVLSIQSEDDPVVPLDGKWMGPFMHMKPESYTADFYRNKLGITDAPEVEVATAANGTTVTTETSVNRETGATVKSIRLQKEGHIWFGGKGEEASSVNATNEIWEFFKNNSCKNPKSAGRD